MNQRILFFIYLGIVVFLSVSPWQINILSLFPDVLFSNYGFPQHVAGYFLLSLFACLTFTHIYPWWILSGIVVLGIVLECIQVAVPERSGNLYDLLGNILGVLLVAVFVFYRQLGEEKHANK